MPWPIEAKPQLIKELGSVKSYTLDPNWGNLYLSRDGSLAKQINKKQTISLPGTYFLTTLNDEKAIQITTFTIPYTSLPDTWHIATTDQLEELLKGVLQNNKEEVTIYFDKSSKTTNQISQIIGEQLEKLISTYPQLYYKTCHMTLYKQNQPKVVLKFTYTLENNFVKSQYATKIYEKAKNIIEQVVTEQMTPYEREWALADYLIKNITYGTQKKETEYTIWGALIEKQAVCDGYAKSFMYLLNSVGVPTLYIKGEGDGVAHAWNLVDIGKGYYHVDLTWADAENNQIGNYYNYINETDAYMALRHTWVKENYPKTPSVELLALAPLPHLKGVYKVNNLLEWEQLKKQLPKETYEAANIIFCDIDTNKWSLNKLLKEIVDIEKTPIQYSSYYKYNALLLNYSKSK